MQLINTASFEKISIVALLKTKLLEGQLSEQSARISQLENNQELQGSQIENLTLMVQHLKLKVRQLIQSNAQLRRQIGGLLFAVSLTLKGREQRNTSSAMSYLVSLIASRLITKLLMVDSLIHIAVLMVPLGEQRKRTTRKIIYLIAVVSVALAIQPQMDRLLNFNFLK